MYVADATRLGELNTQVDGAGLDEDRQQRLRMVMRNRTMMPHPMHIHGHTWALPGSGGLRKDTVLLRHGETMIADLIADNPGEWAFHCHNAYHMETGMFSSLRYE